jgi:hypothetical protein
VGQRLPARGGTFRSSAENFEGVPDEDRAAILGGTPAGVVGFDTTKKLATV